MVDKILHKRFRNAKENITLKIKNNENIGNGDESETIPICFSEVDRRN